MRVTLNWAVGLLLEENIGSCGRLPSPPTGFPQRRQYLSRRPHEQAVHSKRAVHLLQVREEVSPGSVMSLLGFIRLVGSNFQTPAHWDTV